MALGLSATTIMLSVGLGLVGWWLDIVGCVGVVAPPCVDVHPEGG